MIATVGKLRGRAVSLLGSCLVALAVMAAPSLASPGDLDPSFGKDGKVTTGVASSLEAREAQFLLAEAGDGAIVAARQRTLLRYLPDGRLDTGFGSAGRLKVERPANAAFFIADIDIDAQGRIVVVGTSISLETKLESPNQSLDPMAQHLATVLRYHPDGTLDTSFGGGDGVMATTFGLPSPPEYNRPSVSATSVLIDDRGRILVAGTTMQGVGVCKTLSGNSVESFVARLDETGDLDPTFGGGDGIGANARAEAVVEMAFGPSDEIVTLGLLPGNAMCGGTLTGVFRLDADGIVDESFGFQAHIRDYSLRSAKRIAIDARGRIALMGSAIASYLPGGRRGYTGTGLLRLNPDGRPDQTFGRRGKTMLWLPGRTGNLDALAASPRGGFLLAGTLAPPVQPRRKSAQAQPSLAFTVLRVDASGKSDRSFGNEGSIITGFGRRTRAILEEALIDADGRLVVGGKATGPSLRPTGGIALARYSRGT